MNLMILGIQAEIMCMDEAEEADVLQPPDLFKDDNDINEWSEDGDKSDWSEAAWSEDEANSKQPSFTNLFNQTRFKLTPRSEQLTQVLNDLCQDIDMILPNV